eukprot:TRINITY_DN74001_c0_g1_i1.p1 TRINITY_DN74001_c0_g1~~TRINITY_DN74001_c0_g1_i1.p1  ORF type:complete len:316 (+),score=37.40 TRINITY_DN74001_c0_g1_i1:70-948(+)
MASAGGSLAQKSERMPCVFINHGGGPLPLLGRQPQIANFLSGYAATLPGGRQPSAILMVTAHWEAPEITVSGGDGHQLLFDYSGFPTESYAYQYPAPGSPDLARRVKHLLEARGIPCDVDTQRGLDHGVFVPLMLMFPKACVPVIALSLKHSQDAAEHIAVGLALESLRDEGVLIVGSGASFHNFKYIFSTGATRQIGCAHSAAFDSWLRETLTSPEIEDETERRVRMNAWSHAPSALHAHPPKAAEHLMPLFVVFGAAGAGPRGRIVGDNEQAEDCEESMPSFRFSQVEFA